MVSRLAEKFNFKKVNGQDWYDRNDIALRIFKDDGIIFICKFDNMKSRNIVWKSDFVSVPENIMESIISAIISDIK